MATSKAEAVPVTSAELCDKSVIIERYEDHESNNATAETSAATTRELSNTATDTISTEQQSNGTMAEQGIQQITTSPIKLQQTEGKPP